MITQKRFWPFFGVFSGFLGVPQNYIFCSFKSVFWQFLCEKNGWKSRDPARRLVQLFFRLVHWNCLIFGTKVNLGNTYTLQVLNVFDQFLIPSNPPKKAKKMTFSRFFFRLVHRNCLIFGTKVNLGNTYILEVFILF